MEILSYNVCLFITKDGGINFGKIRFQIDNILNIRTKLFINKKKADIIETKFKAKSQIILELGISADFYGCHMMIKD